MSRRHTFTAVCGPGLVGGTTFGDWFRLLCANRFIRQYREMHGVFFEELRLIPHGQFHEVEFEELVADPAAHVRHIYEALELPNFEHVELRLREYVASISGYRQNVFPELAKETRERIAREWLRCFDEWGYRT